MKCDRDTRAGADNGSRRAAQKTAIKRKEKQYCGGRGLSTKMMMEEAFFLVGDLAR
jgi:hypothetical protein